MRTPKHQQLRECIAAALIARGWKLVADYSGSKDKYQHPQHESFLFIGSNGSLRVGRTFSESRVVNPASKLAIIMQGKELQRIEHEQASNL